MNGIVVGGANVEGADAPSGLPEGIIPSAIDTAANLGHRGARQRRETEQLLMGSVEGSMACKQIPSVHCRATPRTSRYRALRERRLQGTLQALTDIEKNVVRFSDRGLTFACDWRMQMSCCSRGAAANA